MCGAVLNNGEKKTMYENNISLKNLNWDTTVICSHVKSEFSFNSP